MAGLVDAQGRPAVTPRGISEYSLLISGYYGQDATIEEIEGESWTWFRLHPYLRERLLVGFFSHPDTDYLGRDENGLPILSTPMGLGGGARDPVAQRAEFLRRHSTSPTGRVPASVRYFEGRIYYLKKGMAPYAPPGSSNHEDGTLDGYAAAADLVGWQDGWLGANAAAFGLIHFANVNSEPWHFQLAGWPNSKSAVVKAWNSGQRPAVFPLPPVPLAVPLPPPTILIPQENAMKTVTGHDLVWLQGVAVARPDGTPVPAAEVSDLSTLVADGKVLFIPRAQVPEQWAFVGAVIAKAGPGGAAIDARFRSVGGQFPS